MKHNFIILLISSLLFTACMVGPGYKRPEVKAPESYQEVAEATVRKDSIKDVEWFTLFNDSILVNLIQEALDSNIDLKRTAQRIEEAKAMYGYTKADLLPSLSYSGSAGRTTVSKNSNLPAEGSVDRYSISGNISWELDLWGKIRHAKNASYNDMVSIMEFERGLKLSLIAEVSNAYFSLIDLDNRMRITEATIASREAYYKIISSRFQYGDVAEIDMLQSEQQLEIAMATKFQLERSIKQTERALCVLLGKVPQVIPRGLVLLDQQVVPKIPEGLPSELLSSRPDMRVVEYQLKAQNDKVGVAVAMRYPSLKLTAMLGLVSTQLSSLISDNSISNAVSADLLGPIFSFGKNKRRVEIERKKYEQLALNYELTFIKALVDVNNSLTGVSTYKEESVHRLKQLEASRKVLTLSKARYDSGFASYIEVLISEQNVFSAELEYSSIQRAYLNSYVDVYKSFGGGW